MYLLVIWLGKCQGVFISEGALFIVVNTVGMDTYKAIEHFSVRYFRGRFKSGTKPVTASLVFTMLVFARAAQHFWVCNMTAQHNGGKGNRIMQIPQFYLHLLYSILFIISYLLRNKRRNFIFNQLVFHLYSLFMSFQCNLSWFQTSKKQSESFHLELVVYTYYSQLGDTLA